MIAFRSSPSRKKQRPRVPDDVRIYAVGDIHGRADLLERVLKRIDADLVKNPVSRAIEVYLGDYIDRGPASRQVLDCLVARNLTHRMVFLKGNHETYITHFVSNPTILDEWQCLGGLDTLMSYGIRPSFNADPAAQTMLAATFDRAFPQSHRHFLENLKSSFTCGDFFSFMRGYGQASPWQTRAKKTYFGFARNFSFAKKSLARSLSMGTPLYPSRTSARTGSTLTLGPMQPGN